MSNNNPKNILFFYVCFAFVATLTSFGENIINTVNYYKSFDNNILSFKILIQAIRSSIPYFVLLINIIIILKVTKIYIDKKNSVIYFFLISNIIQLLGLCINNNSNIADLIHFNIASISMLSTFFLAINVFDRTFILKAFIGIFYIFVFLLIILFIWQNPNISYGGGFIAFFGENIIFLNSNGFSRYLLFVYFFLFSIFVLEKKINYKIIFLIFFIASLIFSYEGRVNIFSLILINLFIFTKQDSIKKKFAIFICLIAIPFTLGNFVKKIDFENLHTLTNIIKLISSTNRLSNGDQNIFYYLKPNSEVTTGRAYKWELIVNKKQNTLEKIFGSGPEADRIFFKNILNEKNKNFLWTHDAANAFLYFYLCGGFLLLLVLMIYIFYELHKSLPNVLLILKKKLYLEKYLLISIFTIIFLSFRSFFENSIASHNLDQTLFILCMLYWLNSREDFVSRR